MGFPWMYGLQSGEFIKIGYAKNIRARVELLQLGNPHPVKVVLRRQSQHARMLERFTHTVLAERAVGREWFRVTPEEARIAADEAARFLAEWRRDQLLWQQQSSAKAEETWKGRGLEEIT